jgi:lysozyme family protein
MNFDQAFDRLISNEGGYVNNPADPGGETKFGISKRSYPTLDIANLTREDAKAIYLRDFWLAGSMDQYDGAIGFQVFDAAVNHGIQTAIRLLQRAVGVADDGHVGPVTVAAVKARSVGNVLKLFIAERLDFWRKLSTWPTFGKGWAGRAAEDLRYAAQDS